MQIKIILSVMVLFSVVFLVPSDAFGELIVAQTQSKVKVAQQNWYNDSWEFRKNITLSLNTATGVSSDLTDFPVLISFTDTDLIQTNESQGRDFVFTQSDGLTEISHEIEKFDNTTGEVIAWVKLPTMSASSTTEIYIYYKGDTIGFNSADVWNDDYVLVWHLNQTSTGAIGEFTDSTSNGNDGRGGGGTKVQYIAGRIPHDTEGQIGNGQELKGPTQTTFGAEGSGDFIWTHDKIEGMPQRDFTIELWVGDVVNGPDNANNYKYNDLVAFCTTHNNNGDDQWSNHVNLMRSGNVKMKVYNEFYVSTSNPGHPVDDNNPAAFTNWNHIVAVYNTRDADGTSGKSQLYINGELVKDQNRSGGLNHPIKTSDLRMALGADLDHSGSNSCAYANNELKGKVDELRISSGLRTASYAAASYFNQGDPDTYTTVDVEETQIEKSQKPQGGPCGQYSDCIKPSIVKHGVSVTQDGFSINDNIFEENQERYNKNPTIQGTVGEPVTIKVRAWENMGTDRISLAITYLGMHEEKPDWTDSTANIKFKIQQDEFKVYDKDKIFSAVGVETEKVIDPYGDNPALEVLDITFTIFFAKPMEPSHIGIQTIDLITNYEFVYFENALEILPREIVQVEEIPEAVPEDMPQEVPEPKEIPKEIPEPPVKEPEPEVILTATTEKTVLSFVDENMPAKHYVKRYITEQEYKEWFDVNYSEYKFWEGIGITQERFDELTLEIELEPEPRIIETGFVLVPDNQKSFPLVEETFESEPVELEPVKEKKGFFDWLFALFG